MQLHRLIENTQRYVPSSNKRPKSPGGLREDVTFYKLDDGASSETARALFQTMINMASADEETRNQMCVYILSAINIWFPMWELIENFMTGINWTVEIVTYPSGNPKCLELSRPTNLRDTLITLGQVILIFCKNFSGINYVDCMTKMVQGIASSISYKEFPSNELALTWDRVSSSTSLRK